MRQLELQKHQYRQALLLPSIAKAPQSLAMPAQVAQTLQDRLLQKEARQMAKSTRIKQKIANINNQIDTLYSDRLVGRITALKYDQLIAKLENKRRNLKNQSNILTSTPNTLKNTIAQMISSFARMLTHFSKRPKYQSKIQC